MSNAQMCECTNVRRIYVKHVSILYIVNTTVVLEYCFYCNQSTFSRVCAYNGKHYNL